MPVPLEGAIKRGSFHRIGVMLFLRKMGGLHIFAMTIKAADSLQVGHHVFRHLRVQSPPSEMTSSGFGAIIAPISTGFVR